MVIKHRGRRFKRSSVTSNGAMVVKPIQPPNDVPSQIQPSEQKGEIQVFATAQLHGAFIMIPCCFRCVING